MLSETMNFNRGKNVQPLQQRLRGWLQTYSMQLALGLSLLIIATTLSAGLPAYWLTNAQLNDQVAMHLADAHQATLSLLQTEQLRLANIALLFAQRPTLATLLAAREDVAANGRLDVYIEDFKEQIGLGLLVLCTADGTIISGSLPVAACPQSEGFLWVAGKVALVARRPLLAPSGSGDQGAPAAIVVTGRWIDAPFLAQLAAGTGVEQTLLGIGGTRLVSSLDEAEWLNTIAPLPAHSVPSGATLTTVDVNGRTHYQSVAPLTNLAAPDEQTIFYSEILLPAGELIATNRRVQAILFTSTALIALLGAGLGAWSIRRITSPLHSLTTVAERISQGEFEIAIPDFDGPIEVQTLTAALQRSQASVVRALAERAAARDRLDNLVQSLVEGVIIVERSGRITFWNEGAALITGWTAADAGGKSLDQVLPRLESDDAPLLHSLPPAGQRQRVSVLTSGGKATVLEITSLRSTHPTPGAETGEERAIVLRDVTEEEAMRHLRSYFLGNISHEFRTPLSTLNASIELLMDESQGLTGAEMRTLLQPIHMSLLELQTLIDNLLEGSTIEAGEFRLRKRLMSLEAAISSAQNVVQPMLERRSQSLVVTAPPHLAELWADPVRLTQVLINLLANASKYTPMGEKIEIKVEVKGRDSVHLSGDNGGDSLYRVQVADRGPGIPRSERVNLFRRFVRLDSSAQGSDQSADVHGTGIGLYVVKTAIEAHGGRVGIDARAGGGSIFWFELPRGEMPQP
jgi:PAS domain S-box-containing protein